MALTTEDIKAIRAAHPVGWFVRAQQRAINQRAQDRLIAEASVSREKELVELMSADHSRKLEDEVSRAKAMARMHIHEETKAIIDQATQDNTQKLKTLQYKVDLLERKNTQGGAELRESDAKLRLIRTHLRDYILGDASDETILLANLEIILDKDKTLSKMVEAVRRRREGEAEF